MEHNEETPLIDRIRPLGDYVLVRRDNEPETSGLIVRPATARYPNNFPIGTVIACGPGDRLPGEREYDLPTDTFRPKRAPMHVKPGDRVIYMVDSALTVPSDDGEEYQMCHEEQHILAVLEEENDGQNEEN